MDNINGNNKVFIYLLVVFFAVFVGSGLFLMMSNKKNVTSVTTAATSSVQPTSVIVPTVAMTQSYLNLKNNSTVNKLADEVSLSLMANSNNSNVAAFDVLINFDPSAFDFVSAVSADPNFKVYPFLKGGELSLTAAQTDSSKTSGIFADVKVVNLVFKPKKIGQSTFKVAPSIGKETTKFVNDKTEVIYPSVNEISVVVN